MRTIGEMLEWLKRHAWKACGLPKGLASSNLALSAKLTALQDIAKPFLYHCVQSLRQAQ